jgi:hypothetical protein
LQIPGNTGKSSRRRRPNPAPAIVPDAVPAPAPAPDPSLVPDTVPAPALAPETARTPTPEPNPIEAVWDLYFKVLEERISKVEGDKYAELSKLRRRKSVIFWILCTTAVLTVN